MKTILTAMLAFGLAAAPAFAQSNTTGLPEQGAPHSGNTPYQSKDASGAASGAMTNGRSSSDNGSMTGTDNATVPTNNSTGVPEHH